MRSVTACIAVAAVKCCHACSDTGDRLSAVFCVSKGYVHLARALGHCLARVGRAGSDFCASALSGAHGGCDGTCTRRVCFYRGEPRLKLTFGAGRGMAAAGLGM
jgi:hypothetical protein